MIENLLSWSLLVGFVLGFIANRTIALLRVCIADKRRPLPDGRKRSKWQAVAIDPRAFAALVMLLIVGWSVYKTEDNAQKTEQIAAEAAAFAKQTQDCQEALILAIIESRKVTAENERITAQNDALSAQERGLLADLARYQAEWLGKVIQPQDPNIARRDIDDPIRQQYGIDVTRGFFNRAGEINGKIAKIHDEQDANDRARPAQRPPLPDPSCGER